jgi:glucokinase
VLTAIGIAATGPSSLGWRDALAAKFGVPVTLENDVRSAAWGEFRFGGHRAGSLLAVFVGEGVAFGAVVDGTLAANSAGELGHTPVVPDGLACSCGGHGCLEQYASGRGFKRRLRAAFAASTPTALREPTGGDPDTLTAEMLVIAANGGDSLARTLWTDAQRYLTVAIAGCVARLNPELLVLGGRVLEDVPELFDEITGGVMVATTSPAREAPRIERARLGDWAGVLGVAGLAAPPARA